MKKIFLLIALMLGMQTSEAQNALPKWLNASLKEGESIGTGVDRQSALEDAIGQLYDRFTMSIDSTSLLATLMQRDSTISVDQRTAWVESAMGNEAFEVKDTLEQDSSYWAHVVVTAENLQSFVERQRMMNLMKGSEFLIRAHICREQGNLIGAAQEYAKGLTAIRPCLHKALNSDLLEGKDLGVILYDEYLTVFDGIELHPLYDSIPVVAGEEIPVDLKFALTAHGKPLSGFPVEGWIEEGRMTSDDLSDAQGLVKLHIKQAPSRNGMKAGVIVNRGLLSTLDESFAKPMLLERLSAGFPMAQTQLLLFDPTPTFFIELDSIDRDHRDSLAIVLTRHGMKQVEEKAEADLICAMNFQMVRGDGVKRGNYMLASSECSMTIKISVQETGEVLGEYNIESFKLTHPSAKSDEDIHVRAVQLMMRRASDEMPAKFSNVAYDKRKVVYGKVAKK